MAEAQLDAGLGYLHSFVADLAAKQGDLDAVGERLGHFHAAAEALAGDLDATRQRVAQSGEERHHQLESALAAAETSTSALLHEGQGTAHALTDVLGAATDERHEQLSAKSDEHHHRLTSAHEHVQTQGFAVADQSVQAASDKLQDQRAQTDVAFQEHDTHVDELSAQVQTSADATTATFDDAGQRMDGDLLQMVNTGLGSFGSVTDQLMGEQGLAGAFQGFGAGLDGGFGQLGDYVNGVGDQMCEQVDSLVADTQQVVEQEVTQRIQESFEKVVVESVEGLLADFVDSIGMMSVGSALTATLAPFVPELATAKTVVSAVDDLLDTLDVFG